MSTGYIYGNRRDSVWEKEGMITRDALKSLTKYGDVPREQFCENVEVPEAIKLFEERFVQSKASIKSIRILILFTSIFSTEKRK